MKEGSEESEKKKSMSVEGGAQEKAASRQRSVATCLVGARRVSEMMRW
jgi:hypothetical protein